MNIIQYLHMLHLIPILHAYLAEKKSYRLLIPKVRNLSFYLKNSARLLLIDLFFKDENRYL